MLFSFLIKSNLNVQFIPKWRYAMVYMMFQNIYHAKMYFIMQTVNWPYNFDYLKHPKETQKMGMSGVLSLGQKYLTQINIFHISKSNLMISWLS